MFNRIEFVIGEALVALSRNRLMTLAAVTTVAVSLFLFGGLGFAYYKMDLFAQKIPGKFNMLVYLKDDANADDVKTTATAIRELAGVDKAFFIPKGPAWERWKQEHPTALTDGVENPLPDGFKVVLKDLKASDEVVAKISAMPAVARENGIQYMRDEQNFASMMLTAFRYIAFGGILLLVIAGVLIYNAIRLTVLSRRLEIRIMQLVGASRPAVYIPFLIEGMLQGVMGALLASGLVWLAYFGFGVAMKAINPTYNQGDFPLSEVTAILSAAGASYGLICSLFAIRAPLKYR